MSDKNNYYCSYVTETTIIYSDKDIGSKKISFLDKNTEFFWVERKEEHDNWKFIIVDKETYGYINPRLYTFFKRYKTDLHGMKTYFLMKLMAKPTKPSIPSVCARTKSKSKSKSKYTSSHRSPPYRSPIKHKCVVCSKNQSQNLMTKRSSGWKCVGCVGKSSAKYCCYCHQLPSSSCMNQIDDWGEYKPCVVRN